MPPSSTVIRRSYGICFGQEPTPTPSSSMEEEVRIILRDTVDGRRAAPRDLAKFTRECFAPLGGVELEVPPRGPMREPPEFS